MVVEVICGELRTGRRLATVPVADSSWTIKHRTAGTVEATVPLNIDEFRKARIALVGRFPNVDLWPAMDLYPVRPTTTVIPTDEYRSDALASLDGARCFLAVVEGDHVLEAGPIWDHDYDENTQRLTVRAAGLWSLWDHRIVMKVLAAGEDPATTSLAYSGLSLGTIAKRLIAEAMSHAGGSLPLILPADVVGTHERTYPGYELGNLGQRLSELMNVIDGPDIAFRPRITEDRLGIEWVMQQGDPLLEQAGADHAWDSTAARGSVTGISVKRSWTALTSRAWSSGSGMDEALPIEFAESTELTDAGFPLTETAQNRSSVTERSTLQSWAAAGLAYGSRPWSTWSFQVRRDGLGIVDGQLVPVAPALGTYRPGDWVRIYIPANHPYLRGLLPGGPYRARILDISGGLGDWVSITCAPTPDNR